MTVRLRLGYALGLADRIYDMVHINEGVAGQGQGSRAGRTGRWPSQERGQPSATVFQSACSLELSTATLMR